MSERQPSSRSCFVCGRDNAAGLRTQWTTHGDANEVRTTLRIPEHFHGYPGVAHGGIVTALLDEAMVRTALLDGDFEDLMVTARMEVTFRHATPTGTEVTVVGRRLRGTRAHARTEAEVRLLDGTIAASAHGILARAPPDVAAAWEREREFWTK